MTDFNVSPDRFLELMALFEALERKVTEVEDRLNDLVSFVKGQRLGLGRADRD